MMRQMSNMRNTHKNDQAMTFNMINPNVLGQEMSQSILNRKMTDQEMRSNMRDIHRQHQALGPNQYIKKDDVGNYVYAYDDQLTEKKEEGNHRGDVKGRYAYTMP